MSDEQTPSSNEAEVQTQSESAQKEQDEFVRRQAYEEVSNDMHKFKQRAKEAAAKASEYEAKLKAIEEEKLKQQEEWQVLYEKERQQREETERKFGTERENYLRSVKLAALKAELGGKVRDIYLNHASLDEIEFTEDGSLSPESVSAVANKFREEHSLLIPSDSGNQITNQAPMSGTVPNKERSLREMSFEERSSLLKNLKK